MLKFNRHILATTALIAATAFSANAANVPLFANPSGPFGYVPPGTVPANQPANIGDYNTLINNINSSGATGINPNTTAQYATTRNYLDNGSIAVAQRGTSAIAGVSTCNVVGSTQAYTADRWCVTSNVASSAATGQVVTASPSPLTGFVNSLNVTRGSGALTSQICAIQEVPTNDSISLQGQQVTFSIYLQALAGLNADNGNAANIFVITGTGSDQGLQTYASASSTFPNWTGLASTITKAVTLTTGWVRYSVTGSVPTGAKEVGVAVCFTPAAGSGGTTDGFAMVGAQLEQGATPSSYEFHPLTYDTAKALSYFYRVNESTQSQQFTGISGYQLTSQNCVGFVSFPQVMRAVPVTTNQLSGTTFAIVGPGVTALSSPVALATTFSAVQGATAGSALNTASIRFITGAGSALTSGSAACYLMSVNGGGKIDYSADF